MKTCKFCSVEFEQRRNSQRYCSTECKTKNNQTKGSMSTKEQYKRMSGNWDRYLGRLVSFHYRQRDGLTKQDLLDIHEEQGGLCALSGIKLTCLLGDGKIKTNASVDRVHAGGPYIKENVQLVCGALNKFRDNTNQDEFVWWCTQVAEYNKG